MKKSTKYEGQGTRFILNNILHSSFYILHFHSFTLHTPRFMSICHES